MPTPAGQLAASLHDYLQGPLGAHRISLTLLDAPGGNQHYAWNITTAAFDPATPVSLDEAMSRYPFGLRMYFQDFIGLIRGDVQVWDIALASMQAWNVGRPLDSLAYTLFQVYGEHQRPDLAQQSYTRLLREIPAQV
ncbi:hypothetical protein POF50_021960 [Streptomyces sp. SL13]|uniref:Uncharacterized protein n=1 Tax=Streptantibioticus silvisoli TaxID=2705255 RepID=A0AA90KA44_9ACTN|nr:hypothetical protein [Streptantibioticus silvisoli]MDI5971968.1 hypothetical protein [Streptantibioticus silvisoli]